MTVPSSTPDPALVALSESLLRATDLESTVAAALGFAATRCGARRAWIYWRASGGGGASAIWRSVPAAGPDFERIARAVMRQRGQSDTALLQPTEGLLAGPLGTGQDAPTLVLEVDAALARADWEALIERVGWRARPLVEAERLKRTLHKVQQSDRLQRTLYEIADLASSDLPLGDMLARVHQSIAGLMYAKNFIVLLCDPNIETLRIAYLVDELDPEVYDPERVMAASEIPHCLAVAMMRAGRPMSGPSRLLKAQFGLLPERGPGPESEDWLGVPLRWNDEMRGALVVQSYDPAQRFHEADLSLLNFVGQHVVTALEWRRARAELEWQVERRTEELARANQALRREVAERERSERLQADLYRIAELAGSSATLEVFYRAVHEIVGAWLNAQNFYIAMLEDDGETLSFPYSVDELDPVRQPRALARGLTEYVLRQARPVLLDRAAIDALQARGEVQLARSRAASWLGVPLQIDARPVGVLAVQSYDPEHRYSQDDLELLTFVAHHIAAGVQRKRAQVALQRANAELEARVAARTAELDRAVRELKTQIEVRAAVQQRLRHFALHDPLTDLPNRTLLLEAMDRALGRSGGGTAYPFAVLFLDLDRFKVINDSVGHLIGDEMLKVVAERLRRTVGPRDLVTRMGGDEFAVLCHLTDADPSRAEALAGRIIEVLSEPIRVGNKELYSSVSIGIALADPSYTRSEELLRDADAAMYRAKSLGRHRYAWFDAELRQSALRLLEVENDLKRALSRGEFLPYFQPIVRFSDRAVVGYEALLRWQHAERGVLAPPDFLSVAEDSGAIEQIDWQLFDATCRLVPELTRQGRYVSINVSARHFRNPDWDESLLALLSNRGVAPHRVRLEITEGTLLDNAEQVRGVLERLRAQGVRVLLDDFGTGFSALSYLHRFPLYGIKIDGSFVAELTPGALGGTNAVVRAIVALADSLGLEVIAEGIETEVQLRALAELGCSLGQGFLFSPPNPASQALLRASGWR